MGTLVLDIGTVGHAWDKLSHVTHEYLEARTSQSNSKDQLGLSPLTGMICMLGVSDLERQQQSVYVVADGKDTDSYRARGEAELLEDFWEGARSYDVFVTFGGRSFDLPFVLHRSIARRVRPTLVFPQTRYVEKQTLPYHIDLRDQFARYGDMRGPLSLHLVCEAYGIESPDIGSVTGKTVGEHFEARAFTDLAEYQSRLLTATTELYKLWKHYLAPPQFLNILME